MSQVETGSYHRIRVVENVNGLYEWILFLSPQTRKASARSPKQYSAAWKARDEAMEFAKKWSKILKNNYSVIDRVTSVPTAHLYKGEDITVKGQTQVEIEDLVGDRRSRGIAAELDNLNDEDFLAIKSLLRNGTPVAQVAKLFNIKNTTVTHANTMGLQ